MTGVCVALPEIKIDAKVIASPTPICVEELQCQYPQVNNRDGVWGLNITKVGHEDAGVYVCQTDDPAMGTVSVRLDIKGNTSRRGSLAVRMSTG